jgi:uncharacterized iron-regulated membrane protein
MKMNRRTLVIFHRWLGLIAGAWLLALGVTGIFLDHDEWRWLRQTEVPENWLSPSMMRYLPATVMRYVVADPADENSWIGLAPPSGQQISTDTKLSGHLCTTDPRRPVAALEPPGGKLPGYCSDLR